MLRWFVSLHSPAYPVSLRKDKMADPEGDSQVGAVGSQDATDGRRAETPDPPSIPPTPAPPTPHKTGKEKTRAAAGGPADAGMPLPDAFTPSINKTLNMLGGPDAARASMAVRPLPAGLTVAQMKTRLGGKAKIK